MRSWPASASGLEAAADIDRLLDAAVAELTTGLDLRDVSVRDLDGTVVTGAGTPRRAGSAAPSPRRDRSAARVRPAFRCWPTAPRSVP